MDELLQFRYQPLTHPESQTRVLHIFPGSPEAPLQLGIGFIDFSAEIDSHFCALSYTWGEDLKGVDVELRLQYDPDSCCVQCGSPHIDSDCGLVHAPLKRSLHVINRPGFHIKAKSQTLPNEYASLTPQCDYLAEMEHIFPYRRKFRITGNLEEALRALRFDGQGHAVWVDQVSINQEDTDEKGYQVKSMGRIYQRASETHAWLGPSANGSGLAIDLVEESDKYTSYEGGVEKFDKDEFLKKTHTWTNHWDAFGILISRPWFKRRWIIQEVVLANRLIIHCGGRTFALCSLARVATISFHSTIDVPSMGSEEPHEAAHAINNLHGLTHQQKRSLRERDDRLFDLTLHELCDQFFNSLCTDKRDIVYSLLSLAHDVDRRKLFPDYSEDATVADAFVLVFQSIVNRTKNLDIIFKATHDSFTSVESWLPCFGRRASGCLCARCCADGRRHHEYKRDFADNVEAGRYRASLSLPPRIEIERTEPTRTLIPEGYALFQVFHGDSDGTSLDESQVAVDDFKESMEPHGPFVYPTLAKLENGPARRGDIVCLLFGCSVPAVLRPCQHDSSEFRFVCGCVLNNEVMSGETLEKCLRDDVPSRNFRIR